MHFVIFHIFCIFYGFRVPFVFHIPELPTTVPQTSETSIPLPHIQFRLPSSPQKRSPMSTTTPPTTQPRSQKRSPMSTTTSPTIQPTTQHTLSKTDLEEENRLYRLCLNLADSPKKVREIPSSPSVLAPASFTPSPNKVQAIPSSPPVLAPASFTPSPSEIQESQISNQPGSASAPPSPNEIQESQISNQPGSASAPPSPNESQISDQPGSASASSSPNEVEIISLSQISERSRRWLNRSNSASSSPNEVEVIPLGSVGAPASATISKGKYLTAL